MTVPLEDNRSGRRPLLCARCGTGLALGRGECYFVEIRAVADPTPPVITGDDLSQDAGREIGRLVARIQGMSERQLIDQVYRRKLFCLCGPCYGRWIEDPVGG
jgi:hypothetical protein